MRLEVIIGVMTEHGDALCLRESMIRMMRLHVDRGLSHSVLVLLMQSCMVLVRNIIDRRMSAGKTLIDSRSTLIHDLVGHGIVLATSLACGGVISRPDVMSVLSRSAAIIVV